jgi:hypothetical protein
MRESEEDWEARQTGSAKFLLDEDQAFPGVDHQHEWSGPDSCKGHSHEWRLCLNMGDTFAYACADAEPVPDEELEAVAGIYREHGSNGLVAWVSNRRKEAPVIEVLEDEAYKKAWAAMYGDKAVQPNSCNKVIPRW